MKKLNIPHTFTIVFSIVIVCAIMTWFIPGGEFVRETVVVDGVERNVVVADSYQQVEHVPQTWQIFTAFAKGFTRTAQIIVFILMLGGAFWIMNTTKAIDIGIISFLNNIQKLQKYKIFRAIDRKSVV